MNCNCFLLLLLSFSSFSTSTLTVDTVQKASLCSRHRHRSCSSRRARTRRRRRCCALPRWNASTASRRRFVASSMKGEKRKNCYAFFLFFFARGDCGDATRVCASKRNLKREDVSENAHVRSEHFSRGRRARRIVPLPRKRGALIFFFTCANALSRALPTFFSPIAIEREEDH